MLYSIRTSSDARISKVECKDFETAAIYYASLLRNESGFNKSLSDSVTFTIADRNGVCQEKFTLYKDSLFLGDESSNGKKIYSFKY